MKNMISCSLVAAALAFSPAAVAQEVAAAPTIQISGPVLRVKNIDASLKFYVDGLGLSAQRRGPTMVILTGPGKGPSPFIMLNQDSPSQANAQPIQVGNGLSRIFLQYPDVKALHAKLTAAGYAPTAISASSGVFFVTDPDGWRYEITGGARAAAAPGTSGAARRAP